MLTKSNLHNKPILKKQPNNNSNETKNKIPKGLKLQIRISDVDAERGSLLNAINTALDEATIEEEKSKSLNQTTINSKTSNIEVLYEPIVYAENKYESSKEETSQQTTTIMIDNTQSYNEVRSGRINNVLHSIFASHNTLQKVQVLRYRENVFRAASKIAKEMPPFPDWAYQDVEQAHLKIKAINVGGECFEVTEIMLQNMSRTRLSRCIQEHCNPGMIFFDRDPDCFRAVLHFYCTGRLHVPPNICLTFFQQELKFWGIDEDFMEPCCWTDFQNLRCASDRLKKYSMDNDRHRHKRDPEEHPEFGNTTILREFSAEEVTSQNEGIRASIFEHIMRSTDVQKNATLLDNAPPSQNTKVVKGYGFRDVFYKALTSGDRSISSMWVSLVCTAFIILSVFTLITGTTCYGRIDRVTRQMTEFEDDELVQAFFRRTLINPYLMKLELVVAGFFLSEILLRFIMCRHKFEFFRDTLNWVDMVATLSSFISGLFDMQKGDYTKEAYLLVLKLPRILRFFKLTESLRNGMQAFTLTIRASSEELQVVFLLLLMVTVLFGSLIFVVEALTSVSRVSDRNSISNISFGIWWAIVTMAGVGFGDFVPITSFGYIIGTIAIMSGVIICQMPVPIFLKNFSIYYNHATARLVSQAQLLLSENVDKTQLRHRRFRSHSNRHKPGTKKAGIEMFNQLFK